MATGTGNTNTESPATLYGPVSLFFGLLAVACLFFYGVFSLLTGIFAATFGVLGLVSGKANRALCAIGLATGAIGALCPIVLLFLYSGGF
ncbi:hypothetical protein [Streptomyces sp. NPDC050504]|uniref:hypothetical protein n=1 Tax=Streptomyces sp. NPDC050504 TaxID=3365618 RepID=UPI0037ABB542